MLAMIPMILGLVLPAAVDGPRVKARAERDSDRLDVRDEEGRTVVTVRSPTGIGRATIERTEDAWPDLVVFRLPLRGLEGFRITRDGDPPLTLDATIPPAKAEAPHRFAIRVLDAQGRPIKDRKPPEGGSFEVTLPRAFFQGQPKAFRVQWVDFYR